MLNKNIDSRGDLTVIQDELDFIIKRVFFISNVPKGSERGEHRHIKNRTALICIQGSCLITVKTLSGQKEYLLDECHKGLILDPSDWHKMSTFKNDAILLALASEKYDPNDYRKNLIET